MDAYLTKTDEVFSSVDSREGGLTVEEAGVRLERDGKNELKEAKKKSLLVKFFAQFKDVMIIVLLVAAAVSATISIIGGEYGELIDSGLIVLIVLANAIIGLVQESKAENALEALKNLNKPYCKVFRGGTLIKIHSGDLVVGDVVQLDAGDIVPADMRLIASASLKIEESALTGESVPVEKDFDVVLSGDAPIGDRRNMAYSSGLVTYGRGKGVVTATGMNTEVGKIATMLNDNVQNSSPLQKQLSKTAKLLSVMVLAIAAVIFVVSVIRQIHIKDAFMTSVAIAVAAIPEGLPAVVTIVLAIGVQRMSKRNAIVKNLPSVETLGCCEIICSDKTGTLTLNQMTVKELYTPAGVSSADDFNIDEENGLLARCMCLCNDTVIDKEGILIGDPTETALVAFSWDKGLDVVGMANDWKRVDELPFDSVRKLMSTVNFDGTDKIGFIKGAPDMLLGKCKFYLKDGKIEALDAKVLDEIKLANESMAENALRVLGFAVKYENLDNKSLENELVFIGLVGMIDPPRREVMAAVKTCERAGMRPIMITGDHITTACAIAREIGILRKGDKVMTGAEIDAISYGDFVKCIQEYSVFARVSPENKVKIVRAYKSLGKIVAMTGDGVNDAPSIKEADIGIGMGITGTEVSKGAADMVLTDDNFATIVGAVEEGRKIFANIKKAIQFLLSANIAEVLCLFIASVILNVEFLTPVMILWVNLVTDSLPALSLGIESAEKDVMNYPPRNSKSSLFAGKTGRDILIQGFMQTILVMSAFAIGNYVLEATNHAAAMTMAFISLCLIQLVHSYNLRSQTNSLFCVNPFSNKFLNLSFIAGVALVLPIILIPAVGSIFGVVGLTFVEWLISIGVAFMILPLVEIQKLIERACERKKNNK